MTDHHHTGCTYGELDEALTWSCGYGDTPTSPPCMAPATWHGMILNEERTAVAKAMDSCDDHRDIMALSATYVHPLDSACGLPGSIFMWPENVCVMPDEDPTALFEAADMAGSAA